MRLYLLLIAVFFAALAAQSSPLSYLYDIGTINGKLVIPCGYFRAASTGFTPPPSLFPIAKV